MILFNICNLNFSWALQIELDDLRYSTPRRMSNKFGLKVCNLKQSNLHAYSFNRGVLRTSKSIKLSAAPLPPLKLLPPC